MRILVQRVLNAKLEIGGEKICQIERGIVAYVGFKEGDFEGHLPSAANKLLGLRIFQDQNGKINNPNSGSFLIIPNFTLYAQTSHGFRPSFSQALSPERAKPLFEKFVEILKANCPKRVFSGVFGANMQITQTNDGPISVLIELN